MSDAADTWEDGRHGRGEAEGRRRAGRDIRRRPGGEAWREDGLESEVVGARACGSRHAGRRARSRAWLSSGSGARRGGPAPCGTLPSPVPGAPVPPGAQAGSPPTPVGRTSSVPAGQPPPPRGAPPQQRHHIVRLAAPATGRCSPRSSPNGVSDPTASSPRRRRSSGLGENAGTAPPMGDLLPPIGAPVASGALRASRTVRELPPRRTSSEPLPASLRPARGVPEEGPRSPKTPGPREPDQIRIARVR